MLTSDALHSKTFSPLDCHNALMKNSASTQHAILQKNTNELKKDTRYIQVEHNDRITIPYKYQYIRTIKHQEKILAYLKQQSNMFCDTVSASFCNKICRNTQNHSFHADMTNAFHADVMNGHQLSLTMIEEITYQKHANGTYRAINEVNPQCYLEILPEYQTGDRTSMSYNLQSLDPHIFATYVHGHSFYAAISIEKQYSWLIEAMLLTTVDSQRNSEKPEELSFHDHLQQKDTHHLFMLPRGLYQHMLEKMPQRHQQCCERIIKQLENDVNRADIETNISKNEESISTQERDIDICEHTVDLFKDMSCTNQLYTYIFLSQAGFAASSKVLQWMGDGFLCKIHTYQAPQKK